MKVKKINGKILELEDFYLINCTGYRIELIDAEPNSIKDIPAEEEIISLDPFVVLDCKTEEKARGYIDLTFIKEIPIVGIDEIKGFLEGVNRYFSHLSPFGKSVIILTSYKHLNGIKNYFRVWFNENWDYKMAEGLSPFRTIEFAYPLIATARAIKPPIACLRYFGTSDRRRKVCG